MKRLLPPLVAGIALWANTATPAFSATNKFQVPALTGPVVDLAQIIEPRDRAYLDDLNRRLYDAAQVQMQILTVPTLDGEPIEQASIAVTDKWKLGKKGTDKGILLFISTGDKKIRIEVGQGLEGDLPDLIASRIIREVIAPQFANGEPSTGVVEGVRAIAMTVAPNEFGAPARHRSQKHAGSLLIFLLYIFFILIFGHFGRRRFGYYGGFGGFGGGFGGGGFGGGGGWSGGGGGFSGGGASGGW